MAEGGVEKRSMRTVLGVDDVGISTSDTFDVVVKDHGVKAGLQYDSVCITPAVDTAYEDAPEKTLQVLCTPDAQMQGSLKFTTVAVCEVPREVTDEATLSKVVRLRSTKPKAEASTVAKNKTAAQPDSGSLNVFASDAETMNCVRLGPSEGEMSGTDEAEGISASDPEALKYVRFGPRPEASSAASADEAEGVFASDPEALKYIRFGARGDGSHSEGPEEGILASDPEALKFIRFGSKPGATAGASNADEPEGIFTSDPEALKCVRIGPNPEAGGAAAASKESSASIFASDPEALKCVGLVARAPKDDGSQPPSKTAAEEAEGELLAEANGIQLKDDRTYSVRVTGHQLPDGQQKKFVSVRSSDGHGGLTREELDNMQVSVETRVGEDGLVEKFIMVE